MTTGRSEPSCGFSPTLCVRKSCGKWRSSKVSRWYFDDGSKSTQSCWSTGIAQTQGDLEQPTCSMLKKMPRARTKVISRTSPEKSCVHSSDEEQEVVLVQHAKPRRRRKREESLLPETPETSDVATVLPRAIPAKIAQKSEGDPCPALASTVERLGTWLQNARKPQLQV